MLGYKNHLVKKFGARSGIEISYLVQVNTHKKRVTQWLLKLIHIKKE